MSKSDSEIQDHLMILDNLVDDQELKDELQSLDDLLDELQEEEAAAAAPVKTPEPRVVWRKRDNTGNIVHARILEISFMRGQDQAGIIQIRVSIVFHSRYIVDCLTTYECICYNTCIA